MGGTFADYPSWHWIFLINLPVGLLALSLVWTFLHEKVQRGHPRIDYLGSALVLSSVGTLIFGLMQGGQAWPWVSPQSFGVFSMAAVLLTATVWVERCAAEPVVPGWLWRWRVLAAPNLAALAAGMAMMAAFSYLPTLLHSVQGVGAITAGLVLASMSSVWPAASALSCRLYMRIGFRDTALIGALLIFLASIGFLFFPQTNQYGQWS